MQTELRPELAFITRSRGACRSAEREQPLGMGVQAADLVQMPLRLGAQRYAVPMATVLVQRLGIETQATFAQQQQVDQPISRDAELGDLLDMGLHHPQQRLATEQHGADIGQGVLHGKASLDFLCPLGRVTAAPAFTRKVVRVVQVIGSHDIAELINLLGLRIGKHRARIGLQQINQ